MYPTDFATRADPYREQLLQSFGRPDPFVSQRAAELDRFDGRFAAHPRLTLLHLVPGGLVLVLAPFQFSSRVRRRHLRLHRWSGRVLLASAVILSLSALFFGLLMPYGGPAEAAATALFGGVFLLALGRAFVAIRRREVARHREWMIRAFAIAIGVSTVRFVMPVLDLTLTPAGLRPPALFALSLWIGWAITLGAAELWIRYTRIANPV